MFKNILIPLDNSSYSTTSRKFALWFASKFSSRLYGQHVIDLITLEGPFLHDLSGSMGFEPYLNLSIKMKEVLESRGKEILNDFKDECDKSNVASESYLDTGIISNEICNRAKMADLVVLAQKGINAMFERGMLGSITETVVRKCPKPVLLTPGEFRDIRKALLCYDGSNYAGQAMQTAAEFASQTGISLTILNAGKDKEEGMRTLNEAKKYFESYSINSEFVFVEGHANEAIVDYSKKNGIDLIFMGAYGHSRIIEMVIGSTTEYVLRNTDCAVLVRR
ncbi:MAG: universal stress protein [Candidatus Schekmanbacteria bacterium]|nr:universal stress protein [Candidatus Schekmanbacteria bacterium]